MSVAARSSTTMSRGATPSSCTSAPTRWATRRASACLTALAAGNPTPRAPGASSLHASASVTSSSTTGPAAGGEDLDVGVAEGVDRLQLVADGAGIVARDELEQLELERVGVLELVDHDALEALAVA